MTVGELIKKLGEFPVELQVVAVRDDGVWLDIAEYAIGRGSINDEDILEPDEQGDMVGIGLG